MVDILFNQVGYIINEFVPEYYRSELFHFSHILSIETNDISNLHIYHNLRSLTITGTIMNINALIGLSLQTINTRSFKGDLSPLNGMSIQTIYMYSFNGDLIPLKGMPIQTISMNSFNGDLSPLKGMSIRSIIMNSFNGDLSPLKGMPIQYISMNSFE